MTKLIMGATTVLILLAAPLAGAAMVDCDAKLVGTSWDCNEVCRNGTTASDCMAFGHFKLSDDFDMFVSDFIGNEGCSCPKSGSTFDNSSKTFECTEVKFPSSFLGKIGSKKLTGEYWDFSGMQCSFSCTKRSSPCP